MSYPILIHSICIPWIWSHIAFEVRLLCFFYYFNGIILLTWFGNNFFLDVFVYAMVGRYVLRCFNRILLLVHWGNGDAMLYCGTYFLYIAAIGFEFWSVFVSVRLVSGHSLLNTRPVLHHLLINWNKTLMSGWQFILFLEFILPNSMWSIPTVWEMWNVSKFVLIHAMVYKMSCRWLLALGTCVFKPLQGH